MAMDLANPTAQTLVWPGSSQYTNSIFVSGMYEIVGFFIDTLAANTAILRAQVSLDSLGTVDASATFVDVKDSAYATRDLTATGTEMADADSFVALSPDSFIIGPVRLRFSALQSDGATGVNGTASDAMTPVFRSM